MYSHLVLRNLAPATSSQSLQDACTCRTSATQRRLPHASHTGSRSNSSRSWSQGNQRQAAQLRSRTCLHPLWKIRNGHPKMWQASRCRTSAPHLSASQQLSETVVTLVDICRSHTLSRSVPTRAANLTFPGAL
jgi:hypothetical protein